MGKITIKYRISELLEGLFYNAGMKVELHNKSTVVHFERISQFMLMLAYLDAVNKTVDGCQRDEQLEPTEEILIAA